MAKIISFIHHKGGTGKTTSCINIAGHLAKAGKKVLIIDLDPQGNATAGLGIDKKSLDNTMYDVLYSGSSMKSIILETDFRNMHIAPSNYDLAYIELGTRNNSQLSHLLKEIKDHYDYVLIDTPPSLGRLMVSGIVASDHIITTLDPGIFALEGLDTLQTVFDSVKKETGKEINISMVLLTKSSKSSLVSKILGKKHPSEHIEKSLRNMHNEKLFLIPNDNNIYEAHVKGRPLSHFSPFSKASIAYKRITEEILKW